MVDAETPFLCVNLEGIEICMNCSPGLDHEPNQILLLQKPIDGLVQSAKQFFKKLIECLKGLGFKAGEVDPCLMIKRPNGKMVFAAIYVDDCLFCGHKDLIDDTIKGIRDWAHR